MSKISTILRNAHINKDQLDDIDSVSVSALDFDFEQGSMVKGHRTAMRGHSRSRVASR
jgi:hypothetical protein